MWNKWSASENSIIASRKKLFLNLGFLKLTLDYNKFGEKKEIYPKVCCDFYLPGTPGVHHTISSHLVSLWHFVLQGINPWSKGHVQSLPSLKEKSLGMGPQRQFGQLFEFYNIFSHTLSRGKGKQRDKHMAWSSYVLRNFNHQIRDIKSITSRSGLW